MIFSASKGPDLLSHNVLIFLFFAKQCSILLFSIVLGYKVRTEGWPVGVSYAYVRRGEKIFKGIKRNPMVKLKLNSMFFICSLF